MCNVLHAKTFPLPNRLTFLKNTDIIQLTKKKYFSLKYNLVLDFQPRNYE